MSTAPVTPAGYRYPEASAYIGVSVPTLKKLVREGIVEATRADGPLPRIDLGNLKVRRQAQRFGQTRRA